MGWRVACFLLWWVWFLIPVFARVFPLTIGYRFRHLWGQRATLCIFYPLLLLGIVFDTYDYVGSSLLFDGYCFRYPWLRGCALLFDGYCFRYLWLRGVLPLVWWVSFSIPMTAWVFPFTAGYRFRYLWLRRGALLFDGYRFRYLWLCGGGCSLLFDGYRFRHPRGWRGVPLLWLVRPLVCRVWFLIPVREREAPYCVCASPPTAGYDF